MIECSAPTVTKDLRDKLEIDNNPDNADLIQVEVEFKMDGVNSSLLRQTLEIVSDPVFYNFTEEGMTKELVEGIRTVIIIRVRPFSHHFCFQNIQGREGVGGLSIVGYMSIKVQ